MTPLFPSLDPLPLPAPIWLLKVLLDATFLCHVVFMNLTVGGAVLAAVFSFKGKAKHLDVAGGLAKGLPYTMAFTITFGVAPLLFMQVLYGPLFYTSSILLATPFFLIIPAVMTAYGLMYLQSAKWASLGRARGPLAVAIVLALGFVGFTYTNVFTMMLEPMRFQYKYLTHPDGFQMNLVNPSVLPRFLHMMLGALAVGGLWVAVMGVRRLALEPEQGRWQYRSGATWFAGATLVNLAVGTWWLLGTEKEVARIFMGGSWLATAAFALGVVSGVAALVLALLGINALKPAPLIRGCVHALGLTLACMVVMRDALRDAELRPDYTLHRLHTSTQQGAIAIFLVLFAAGVWLGVWLIRQLRKHPPKPGGPGRPPGPGLSDSGLHRISESDSGLFRGGLTESGSGSIPGPSTSGSRRVERP